MKIRKQYDNLGEYISEVTSGDFEMFSSRDGSQKFTGTANFEESLRIAREGTDLGTLELELDKVESDVEQYQMETEFAVSGAYVDIGRYMSGEPECMVDQPMLPNLKVKTIVFDSTESAMVDKKLFLNKAIGISHLIDKLEASGTRVELFVFMGNDSCRGNDLRMLTRVKAAEDRLSVAQLMGVLHPGFFRRVTFAWIEKMMKGDPGGYGMPMMERDSFLKELTEFGINVKEAVILPNVQISYQMGFNTPLTTLFAVESYVNYFYNKSEAL